MTSKSTQTIILLCFMLLLQFRVTAQSFLAVQSQDVIFKKNLSELSKLTVYSNESGQKRVGFYAKSEDNVSEANLQNIFSATTNFSNYDLLKNNGFSLVHFKAADGVWLVSYYWNYANDSLYYIAENTKTKSYRKSTNLKSISDITNFVNRHFINPTNPTGIVQASQRIDAQEIGANVPAVVTLPTKKSEPEPVVITEIEPPVETAVETVRPPDPEPVQIVVETVRDAPPVEMVVETVRPPEPEPVEVTQTNETAVEIPTAEPALVSVVAVKNSVSKLNIVRNSNNKRQLEFLEQGQDLGITKKVLANEFADDTELSNFELLKDNAGNEIICFNAGDNEWTVDYYWQLATEQLHYVVKGNNSGKITRSGALRNTTPFADYINTHYNQKYGIETVAYQAPAPKPEPTEAAPRRTPKPKPEPTTVVSAPTPTPQKSQPATNGDISAKLEDYFGRLRMFTFSIENNSSKNVELNNPKVMIEITGTKGYYKEQYLYTDKDITLQPRSFGNKSYQLIEDNFVTSSPAGGYALQRINQPNIPLLPSLTNGSYTMRAIILANEGKTRIKSNAVNFRVPMD